MTGIEKLIVAAIILILAILGAPAVVQANAHRQCLALGYPDAKVGFPLTAYCVKRVNQTDSVVALSKLR